MTPALRRAGRRRRVAGRRRAAFARVRRRRRCSVRRGHGVRRGRRHRSRSPPARACRHRHGRRRPQQPPGRAHLRGAAHRRRSTSRRRSSRSRAFGATHALDPATATCVAEVRALTGGRGADYVFVTVGRGQALEHGLGSCGAAGRSSSSACRRPGETSASRQSTSRGERRAHPGEQAWARHEPRGCGAALVDLYAARAAQARRADLRPLPARADQRGDRGLARRRRRCAT